MANDFDRFLGAVTAGTALDARAPGQRFVPPAAPEPNWHAVRGDLEDTLQNLHAIRDALLTLQRSIEALRTSPAAAEPAEPPTADGPAEPPAAPRLGEPPAGPDRDGR